MSEHSIKSLRLSESNNGFSDNVLAMNNQGSTAVDALFQHICRIYDLSDCMSYQMNRIRPLILSLVLRGQVNLQQNGNSVEVLLHLFGKYGANIEKISDKEYIGFSTLIKNMLSSQLEPKACIQAVISQISPTSESRKKEEAL